VQTNIYLTPASNQGFRTHYDNHDVMVVQVEGEKLWRFYNSFAIPEAGQVVCIGANSGITVEFDMIKDLQTEYLWCRLSEIMADEKV
jgi:ribosomal protein L16 Arg81 hydroxylase